MAKAHEEKSISELLADEGLGHRHAHGTKLHGKHEIFNIATGEVFGLFSAHEAVEFLNERKIA